MTDTVLKKSKLDIVLIIELNTTQVMMNSMSLMKYLRHSLVWMECKWIETEEALELRRIFI